MTNYIVMNKTISKNSSSVGCWKLLGFWIITLILSQFMRILFAKATVFNLGLAFGVMIPNQLIIPVMVLFLLLILIWYFKTLPKSLYEIAGFGMILGGGTSNLLERFMFAGKVADYWPLFNISTINLADVFIGLGILIMLVMFIYRAK